MLFKKPRLVIAALRGGSGKTLVSLGLVAYWRKERRLRVVPFKKGPDYIDAGWLSVAAGSPCYNLDPFLMDPADMLGSFLRRSLKGDCSVIEGNRGLYDGVDSRGTYSTAELAKFLRAPVVLVIDGTKMTGTAAALVLGCQKIDPEVRIAGIIFNHVAGKRHENVLRRSIEEHCEIPVLGILPKEAGDFFPERHLGLVPPQESRDCARAMDFAAKLAQACLDTDGLLEVAKSAAPLGMPLPTHASERASGAYQRPVIGILRDAAFQFYYPENIEALRERGAEVVEISSFDLKPLPALDGLYIGGGFPETHLEVLARNKTFKQSLTSRIDGGLPVYAECGGLMFLCKAIHQQTDSFPMAGVFPYEVVMEKRPQGHGYVLMDCVGENPYFPVGTRLRGHEFHYSRIGGVDVSTEFVFNLTKGHGMLAGKDGLCYKNVLAAYAHLHAVGNGDWADAMVGAALSYREQRSDEVPDVTCNAEKGESGNQDYSTAV
ncbi:MAG: cobyrinate a,c-diamide synthase [Deltaproteobacteria bacterium]|nr:cobyrinate a,c-diamide synthase [Deltaproteobacteria bacterium]